MLVNGVSHDFFQFKGGLRQGDPLSSHLFIIAAEFLSRGLDCIYAQYPSVRYCSTIPIAVSYLNYADDIVIF